MNSLKFPHHLKGFLPIIPTQLFFLNILQEGHHELETRQLLKLLFCLCLDLDDFEECLRGKGFYVLEQLQIVCSL